MIPPNQDDKLISTDTLTSIVCNELKVLENKVLKAVKNNRIDYKTLVAAVEIPLQTDEFIQWLVFEKYFTYGWSIAYTGKKEDNRTYSFTRII